MIGNFTKIFLLELNEINFDFVKRYGDKGELPNLTSLIEKHGLIETDSEQRYDELEPWIQWVTAHSGKSFAEHGVFRLGDIVQTELVQIWEFLEAHGLKVGAMSPMNAANRTEDAAFFVSDPWTNTKNSGNFLIMRLADAISQAVNDNAQARISAQSAFWLGMSLVRYSRAKNFPAYGRIVSKIMGRKSWAKALLLEELLVDVTLTETRRTGVDFVSLFLNAGAHIQHHYMFNATVYNGIERNPEWLVRSSDDPILDVYTQYDRAVGRIRATLPQFRLIIATGLHQDPYPTTLYYWRLKDHDSFLRRIGVDFIAVEPRMSRDFLIQCNSVAQAVAAQEVLEKVVASDGIRLFEVDRRNDSLFVMLTYPRDIADNLLFSITGKTLGKLKPHTVFVAIKNGEHNGVGYLIDTDGIAEKENDANKRFELKRLPARIAAGFGLDWPQAI